MQRRKYIVNIGDVYGKYTVLEKIQHKTRAGNIVWRYLCEDKEGNKINCPPAYFLRFLTPEEIEIKFPYDDKPLANGRHQMGIRNSLYYDYQLNAKKREIHFDLSFEDFDKLIVCNCHYCGSIPVYRSGRWSIREHKNQPPLYHNGIDRITSHRGYTVDNTVPCCIRCNLMKHTLEVDDFLSHVERIYNFNKEGSTTIPNGSTSQVNGDGNGDSPYIVQNKVRRMI